MVAGMEAGRRSAEPAVTERFVEVFRGALFTRSLGEGERVIVLHGGPGIVDHTYLLPEMDRLADVCQLVYYDQRGHGRSRGELNPDDVSIDRFVEDLGSVCDALELDVVTLLGHSWGTHLALQFATQRPERVNRLILMNTFPASSTDHARYVEYRNDLTTPLTDELRSLTSSAGFEEGDPELAAEHLRLLTSAGIKRAADASRLRLHFTRENVLRGRMIFQRFEQTLFSRPFDLLPKLARLTIPTLVIHGDHDFVPVTAAEHVAAALGGSRLVVIPECGHCAYLEAMDTVYAEVADFMRHERQNSRSTIVD